MSPPAVRSPNRALAARFFLFFVLFCFLFWPPTPLHLTQSCTPTTLSSSSPPVSLLHYNTSSPAICSPKWLQSTGYVAVPKSGHCQTCLVSHTFNIEYYSTENLIHIVAHVYQNSASSENI